MIGIFGIRASFWAKRAGLNVSRLTTHGRYEGVLAEIG
jgi:hypothetical protein